MTPKAAVFVFLFMLALCGGTTAQQVFTTKISDRTIADYLAFTFSGQAARVHESILNEKIKACRNRNLTPYYKPSELDTLGGYLENIGIRSSGDDERDTAVFVKFNPDRFSGFIYDPAVKSIGLIFTTPSLTEKHVLYYISERELRSTLKEDDNLFWEILLRQMTISGIDTFSAEDPGRTALEVRKIFSEYAFSIREHADVFEDAAFSRKTDSAALHTIYTLPFLSEDNGDEAGRLKPADISSFLVGISLEAGERNSAALSFKSVRPAHEIAVTGIDRFTRSLFYIRYEEWMATEKKYARFFTQLALYSILQRTDIYDSYTQGR